MKVINFWKPAVWLAVICYMSLMPGNGLPKMPLLNIPHLDKIVHCIFYFVLTLLLIKPVSKISAYPYLISMLFSALISGVIEILQSKYAVMRHGDIYDFFANLTGIILAFFFYRFLVSGKKIEAIF